MQQWDQGQGQELGSPEGFRSCEVLRFAQDDTLHC